MKKKFLYRVTEATAAAAMNATSINDKIQTEQQLTIGFAGIKKFPFGSLPRT